MTTMMGVPPIYLFLAQQPRFADADLSSLERAVVGGAPMPEALLETWAARGTAIVQGYGLTEAAPNVLCLPPEDAVRKLGFAGKPYPFVDVRLSAEERAAGAGAERLPRLLAEPRGDRRGVHRRTAGCARATSPRATARASTGSRAGSRTCTSPAARTSTRPRSRRCCTSIRGSRDAAVVGVPHERWGEVGVAFVVCRRRQRGRADRVVRRAARALQGAEVGPLRRRDPAQRARQDPEAGASSRRWRDDRHRHRRRRPRALGARRRDAAAAARGGRAGLRASSATTTRRS